MGFSGVQPTYTPEKPKQRRLKDASLETLVARELARVARAHAAALAVQLEDWTPPQVLRCPRRTAPKPLGPFAAQRHRLHPPSKRAGLGAP